MSDLLIRGMELPVTCCHCPLMGYDPDIKWVDGGREKQGAYICVITHELIDNTKREDHCPLVPVPPHGRLIDADAEIARVQNLYNKAVAKDPEMGCVSVYEGEIAVLKLAPTIIPAEEGKRDRH